MSRTGAVTFKGNPMTLAGQAVQVGQTAPDFTLHRFEAGAMKTKNSATTAEMPEAAPMLISAVRRRGSRTKSEGLCITSGSSRVCRGGEGALSGKVSKEAGAETGRVRGLELGSR